MKPEQAIEPDEALFAFLSGLPATIKTEILLFVLIYAFQDVHQPPFSEMDAALRRHLLEKEGLLRVSAVLCASAATDHVLRVRTKTSSRALQIALRRQLGPKIPERLAKQFATQELRAGLMRKHVAAAAQAWRALQAGALSHPNLMDFEDRCLGPPDPAP